MPTNVALDEIRTRRGLKWGVAATLLAVPYLLAASVCTSLIANGAPGWLNLFVLLFIWNALKFLIMGPVSLVLLVRVRLREATEHHRRRTRGDSLDRVVLREPATQSTVWWGSATRRRCGDSFYAHDVYTRTHSFRTGMSCCITPVVSSRDRSTYRAACRSRDVCPTTRRSSSRWRRESGL